MERVVVWIVGEPGAGKTCIVRSLIRNDNPQPFVNGRVKWTVGRRTCAAGTYTGAAFDGADTVPYDGARPCLEFWRDALAGKEITILDGDRFSNAAAVKFFQEQPGVKLVCVHVACATAAARRAARSSNVQNATWVKGRTSKALNFYNAFPGARLGLVSTDGGGSDGLAQSILDFIRTL